MDGGQTALADNALFLRNKENNKQQPHGSTTWTE
jgi:hypothetical protein